MSIVTGKLSAREKGGNTRGVGQNGHGDRPSLDLIGAQEDLVKAIPATGKPVYVVPLRNGSISIGSIRAHVPAILGCLNPGQVSGRSVTDVHLGVHSPSGKSSVSFPRSAGHFPCYSSKPFARRGDLRDDVSPSIPSGYGLSSAGFIPGDVRPGKYTMVMRESRALGAPMTKTGQSWPFIDGQHVVAITSACCGEKTASRLLQSR